MYFVKYGNRYLHDPRVDGYSLFDLSLEAEENSCGYCDFTIYPDHPLYDKIRERDADNPIEVYDDDTLLFAGFIYELGKEFYLDGHVKCKGELDYLSESIVRPYATYHRGYGDTAPDTVDGYFEWLIYQHNLQVTTNKQFVVGTNLGRLLVSDNFMFAENDMYPNTIDELSEMLLNDPNIGGYLTIRHVDGVRYIDYRAAWDAQNTQILDFGVNLTDYTQTDDSAELKTFIVPLGASMSNTEYSYDDGYYQTADTSVDKDKEYYTLSEDGYFMQCSEDMTAFESGVTYYEYYENYDESNLSLTLEGMDDILNSGDYKKVGDKIYCASSVAKYGWIGTTYTDSDIIDREELYEKGLAALKEMVSPKRTIEIKAVDMHLINPDIKPIRVGEYVRVRSVPHNLDGYFLCRNIDLDLNNPENSLYTLGTTFDTLTGEQNKRIKSLNESINKQYESAAVLSEEAKESAKDAAMTAQKAQAMAADIQAEQDEAICALYEMIVGE